MKADTMSDEAIRPGYKCTEVGVIPDDWDAKQLGDVSEIVMGQSPIGSSYNTFGYGIPLINGPTEFTDKRPVKIQWTTQPTKLSKKGDVLLCVRGSSTGRINVSNDTYCIGRGVAAIRSKEEEDRAFFLYLVTAAVEEILLLTTGSTFPNVDGKTLRRITIRYPSLPYERRAIADVLSDVDALLDALDRLIAKKRAIKQGAMQALLTGRVRLPGFSGEWVNKQLSELADIRSGGTPSTTQPKFWDGPVPWCTPTDITALQGAKYLTETRRTITVEGLENSSAEIIPARSIVMTSRATIGECAINLIPVSTNQGFKNFVPFEDVDVEFLYYLLTTKKQQFISLCGGSTFLEIGRAQLATFEVILPATTAEQRVIAEVLSDMDAEIDVLEKRRAKLGDIKHGMMQELLTGRIRLVKPKEQAQEASV